jgi:hypothetical protein
MPDNKFQEEVHDVLQEIEDLLVAKNEKYGNSALEPLGVFSQLSAKQGLLVRIDDKLKRIKHICRTFSEFFRQKMSSLFAKKLDNSSQTLTKSGTIFWHYLL